MSKTTAVVCMHVLTAVMMFMPLYVGKWLTGDHIPARIHVCAPVHAFSALYSNDSVVSLTKLHAK